eukprot:7187835-Prymnesium_polylepis.1
MADIDADLDATATFSQKPSRSAPHLQRKGLMRPTLDALPTVWELAWKQGVGLQRLMKRVVLFVAMVTTVAAIFAEAEAPQVRQGRQGWQERQTERGQRQGAQRSNTPPSEQHSAETP